MFMQINMRTSTINNRATNALHTTQINMRAHTHTKYLTHLTNKFLCVFRFLLRRSFSLLPRRRHRHWKMLLPNHSILNFFSSSSPFLSLMSAKYFVFCLIYIWKAYNTTYLRRSLHFAIVCRVTAANEHRKKCNYLCQHNKCCLFAL